MSQVFMTGQARVSKRRRVREMAQRSALDFRATASRRQRLREQVHVRVARPSIRGIVVRCSLHL